MATNWGRWGKDDERGAANLIDSAAVLRGVGSVQYGRSYPLGIAVRGDGPVVGGRQPPLHLMRVDGADYLALSKTMVTPMTIFY